MGIPFSNSVLLMHVYCPVRLAYSPRLLVTCPQYMILTL